MKKRTTLELTINTDYVRSWEVWEGVRELIQNAKDADDMGYPMTVDHVTNTQQPMLRIVTDGTTLDRSHLLLGTTTKAGRADQRGEFGEGLKLAMLVLTRLGYTVRCRTGEEQWIPKLDHSEAFDSPLLKVDCSPVTYRNKIQIDVIGIDAEAWESVRERCLFLADKRKKLECIDLGDDQILTGDDSIGLLYVKGIFVCKLPGRHFYGYNLWNVQVDRDRRIADPWDLKYEISRVLNEASSKDKIEISDMYQMLMEDGFEESAAVATGYRSGDLASQLAEHFEQKHGDNAVVVKDTAESADAAHHGMKGVVVGRNLQQTIERVRGDYESRKRDRATDHKDTFSFEDLTEAEAEGLCWGLDMVEKTSEKADLDVVDFHGANILASYQGGEHPKVRIARKILTNRRQLLIAIVHELAHAYGGDGSVEHRDACDNIFAGLVLGPAD
jgi:hypothetical protein